MTAADFCLKIKPCPTLSLPPFFSHFSFLPTSDSERVQGQSFHHTAWHKGRDYHTVVVGCHFPHSVGGKEGGGVLLLDLEIGEWSMDGCMGNVIQ